MEDRHNTNYAKKGCHVLLARKSTTNHYMISFLKIRKSPMMEINHKIIMRKLKLISFVMSNVPAYWESLNQW